MEDAATAGSARLAPRGDPAMAVRVLIVDDQRLPWERPLPPARLAPCRVRRGFQRLLCTLGSPAATPKPCGRSPGRPKGRRSGPATRYPAVKKTSSKSTKPVTAA